MPANQIKIRQVNPATKRSTVIRLLKENLPEAATDGRFDWAYLENPDGKVSVWLAETADGDAVGTSAAFPRQFRIEGNPVQGLVLSDFAIDQRFRTLGPAISLLRATLESVDNGSFEFALDHPSESMLAVYKRLGGVQLGRLRRYVRLLKVSGATERRWGAGLGASVIGSLGDFSLRMIDRFRRIPGDLSVEVYPGQFDDDFIPLSSALEKCGAVFGDRRPDYLNWRYRSGIRFDVSTVVVKSGKEMLGYAVLQQGDAATVTIAEFVCPDDDAFELALFHGLLDFCHQNNIESLQASCVEGGAWSAKLERLGFVAREQSAGPVVYSRKGCKWNEILTDKAQWWMTDGDRDG